MVDKELMDHILKLHIEQGRTQKSLAEEYGISSKQISYAKKKYYERTAKDKKAAEQLAAMEEYRRLKEENEELKKEVDFLKKAAAFFANDKK